MPPNDGKPELLLFDFDGTVADTLPLFVEAVNDAAARYRFRPIDGDAIPRLRGLGPRAFAEALGLSAWKTPALAHHVRAYMRKRAAGVQLFEGIPDVLMRLLDGGRRIAFVTSNAEVTVRSVLGSAIADRVAHFECGAAVHGKARRFRRTLRTLGITPYHALAIGDEQRDARAAAAAGVRFGAVTWGYATPEALASQRPYVIFDSPADLLRLL